MATNTINVFLAVAQARATKDTEATFSIKFRKWNRQKGTGGDLCYIQRARCRAAAANESVANAGHKLFFTDLDRQQSMTCWQPLIVEFNGSRCNLD